MESIRGFFSWLSWALGSFCEARVLVTWKKKRQGWDIPQMLVIKGIRNPSKMIPKFLSCRKNNFQKVLKEAWHFLVKQNCWFPETTTLQD